jgi:uncharacterized protein YlaI
MKTIELKKLENFDYREVLTEMLKNAPAQGYTVQDVRLAVKALDALEKAEGQVNFEDEVFEFVKRTVNEAKFRVASRELVEFLNEFI